MFSKVSTVWFYQLTFHLNLLTSHRPDSVKITRFITRHYCRIVSCFAGVTCNQNTMLKHRLSDLLHFFSFWVFDHSPQLKIPFEMWIMNLITVHSWKNKMKIKITLYTQFSISSSCTLITSDAGRATHKLLLVGFQMNDTFS